MPVFREGLDDWFINDLGVGLLGQVGFFDRFTVAFDWTTKCFAVETKGGQEYAVAIYRHHCLRVVVIRPI